jgi:DNA processing protein
MKAEMSIWPLQTGMDEHERLCVIGLSYVDFLRPKEKLALIGMKGSAARLFDLTLADFPRLLGRRFRTDKWLPAQILRQAEAARKILTASGIRCIFYEDPEYPPLLREIYDPPLVLFVRGPLLSNAFSYVAVVGTRYPTGAARTAAFQMGFELGREGIGVVSGLARGIDREAHEGCVEAGGCSVAVLGNGIDAIYPESSRQAAWRILRSGGTILSEYPPGVPPLHYHFPARNRIISGLSRSVVIVQAPARSGALITAEYALEQGKDLTVHAAGLAGNAGVGTMRLADCGAPVIEGSADILRDWGMASRTRHAVSFPGESPAGDGLAKVMERETEGNCGRNEAKPAECRADVANWRERCRN